jgi:putative endonuclease
MKKKFKRKGTFYVYILECADGTYYTGYTPDLAKRIDLHNIGKGAKYTRGRGPVTLIWYREFKYFRKAVAEERRIKQLTRKQKELLISTKR